MTSNKPVLVANLRKMALQIFGFSQTIFGFFKSIRTLLFGICFACLFFGQSQLSPRKLSEALQQNKVEKELSQRIQRDSGAFEIECVARTRPIPGYNYSFNTKGTNLNGIPGRQWCCVTPNMHDIIKVKNAPDQKLKNGSLDGRYSLVTPLARSDHHNKNVNGTIIIGADKSEWRVPDRAGWSWKCLPSFIIAGTQKSGSTALAAYLLAHPQVSLGRSKEVHFFDKTISLGLLPYLINFAAMDGSGGMGLVDETALAEVPPTQSLPPFAPPFVNGEATPFYIADRHACHNIKKHLPESPSMIVLLRDPTERAYSEYMMKKRRVDSQDEFLDILDRHAFLLLQCLSKSLGMPMGSYGNRSSSSSSTGRMSVENCAPDELTAHAKWKDLKKALRSLTSPDSKTRSTAPQVAKHPLDNVLPCFYTRTPWGVPPATKPYALPLGIFSTEKQSSQNSTSDRLSRFYVTRSALSEASFVARANKHSEPYVHFDVERCVPKGLGERFPSTTVFKQEMESFSACAGEVKSLIGLDAAVSKCVKVHHGISSQFIYRSMYAAQLYHCFKSVSQEKFLVLDSALLKQNPREALRLVHSHIGISDFDYHNILDDSPNPAERLQLIFDSYYPSFEERTGWRMDGEYEPIAADLKKAMDTFFKPHNALLESLTNQTFKWGA